MRRIPKRHGFDPDWHVAQLHADLLGRNLGAAHGPGHGIPDRVGLHISPKPPHGKSDIRIALEQLPVGGDRSVFVAFGTGGSLYTILRGIKAKSGYTYRTHETVR